MIQASPEQSEHGRVAVGMSGGLDSSVVAALLVEAGYEVIGLTLHMFKEGSRCCSVEDVERARGVCSALGIRHYVVNAVEAFEDVIIRPFVAEYARGRTPSPCILCNQHMKFGALHRRARLLGCARVATGHYARILRRDGRWRLFRAADRAKDQSYFLHRLCQDQLARSLFPLEAMTKTEVASYAREKGVRVSTSSSSESQDLCFIPDEGPAPFLEQYRPELKKSGEIVDTSGRTVGRHPGFHHFTIGQRKGLRVAAAGRLYVKDIDPRTNRVFIAPRGEVMNRHCRVHDVHWVSGEPPAPEFACTAAIRYRHPPAPVRVRTEGEGGLWLEFEEPQFAVTPGQAAVLYDGDEVLGGGWIEKAP